MRSIGVVLAAASLLVALVDPAACASAPAAARFPEVPLAPSPRGSHLVAYAFLATGAGLIGGSFVLSRHADQLYRDYLVSSDPDRIVRLYDDTAHYDRLSSAALISGQVMVAAGLYFRFLRRPSSSRIGLVAGPDRCALALRF